MTAPPDILEALDRARFYSLSVVRSGHEWQANLQVERGAGFRVCHGSTAGEAIAALFAPTPTREPAPISAAVARVQLAVPPCPVPLPPCSVPA